MSAFVRIKSRRYAARWLLITRLVVTNYQKSHIWKTWINHKQLLLSSRSVQFKTRTELERFLLFERPTQQEDSKARRYWTYSYVQCAFIQPVREWTQCECGVSEWGAPTAAGTAPWARTMRCMSRATCTLAGRGRPCVRSADSSATTGAEAARAARTSSLTRSHDGGAPAEHTADADADAEVGEELSARRTRCTILCCRCMWDCRRDSREPKKCPERTEGKLNSQAQPIAVARSKLVREFGQR